MKTILVGALMAFSAHAGVITTLQCEFTDIQTEAVLSTACDSIYGSVAVTDASNVFAQIDQPSVGMETGGFLAIEGSIVPDYWTSVWMSGTAMTQWSFEKQYVITGGTGVGTVRGLYTSGLDSFGVQPSFSAATDYASYSQTVLSPLPFEYFFTFGQPVTFFATGEIAFQFGPTSAPLYEADVNVFSAVLAVFDSAGQPVDAQFTPIPEPQTLPLTAIVCAAVIALTAIKRLRRS